MMEDWELAGGIINILWTASHAEKRTSDRSKWSAIEFGNDLADRAALRARIQVKVVIEGNDQAQVKRGGIWSYRNADLEFVRLDGPLKQTWKQLAGRHHLSEMNKTRRYEAKSVDERVLLWPKAAYEPLPLAFFRTQLIYGQLPSARVWYRNHKIAGPEAEICTLCQKQGKFKTDIWHILAECPAPGLIEIRRRHQAEVHRYIISQFSKLKSLRAALLLGFKFSSGENGWLVLKSDGVTEDEDGIVSAAGQGHVQADEIGPDQVESVERPRRGEFGPQPSPWFGIFPRSWLDSGAQEIGVQEGQWRDDLGKEVNSMRRALAGLSKLTIAGCRATWQVAGGLWAEINRQEQQFLQAAHKVAIVVELRREAADREVLGAKAMWRAQEARAARQAAARELKGGKARTARTFPVDWVSATWRAYGKVQLETGEKRRRRKNLPFGKQLSQTRQQSIGESLVARDRALGLAAQPVKLSASGMRKRPREEMKLIRMLFKRPKNANGVG
jgi:hypothetical protein